MAKVKITGHASGSGVFTITAPNSNTDRTITLPDASVTLGTDATKLPLAGGALTGALTTNSTIDGRDVAADGVLATNALPKAGGTLTGNVVIGAIADNAERSLTINSSADSYLRLKTQNDNEVGAIMFGNATNALDGRIQYDSRRMRFFTGNAERLNLTADGRGLSQFTAKAWCNGNFNDGTPDIQDSFNVSSVEYMGSTGYFAVHWDVDTANGDYASFINCYSETATQTGYVDAGFAQNSSYLRFQFYRNGSLYNPAEGHLIIFGD